MADFLGAATPEEVIIGPNMTTLTYQMSRTLGRGFAPGDEIIVTRMDHEGNVSPWLQLAEDRGLTVRFLPFDTSSWQVEADDLGKLLGPRTRLVALNYASNLTGSINPVKQLVRLARAGRRADLCRRRAVRAARAGRRRRISAAISSPARPTNSSGRIWACCGAGATMLDALHALQVPLLVERAAGALRARHAADRADGRACRRRSAISRAWAPPRVRPARAATEDRRRLRRLDRLRGAAGAAS